ncbi:MAG: SURF1 family protein [Ahrensia sp.]|nr:SURF1 family protein [Ahrensia sp.]
MTVRSIILLVAIVLGTAFLSGLGVWQLQRLAWKEALIERVETGLSKEPVSVAAIEQALAAGEDVEYRPARATGSFLHAREAHYFATFKGQPGYFVYTPLQLDDGRMLFVNRGFVTMNNKDRAVRPESLVEGRQEISGLARNAPSAKPNSFVPDNDLEKNIFYWKSLTQMTDRSMDSMAANVVPFFLDADDAPVPGGITGGVTRITFPNSHLQYALTWFGLAGTLLVVGLSFFWSRRKAVSA